MAEIQKNYDSYKKLNTRVVALSVDPVKQSRNLAEKMKLSFELLSDEDKHVIDLFNLRNPFEHDGIAYPATFIMNPEGKICYRSLDGTASRVDLSDELKFLEKLHDDAGYKMDTAPKKSWIVPSIKDTWRMSSNLIFNGNFADWKHFFLLPVEMFRMMASKSKQTIFRGIVGLIGLNLLLIGLGFLVAPSKLSSQFWIHASSIAGFATVRGDLGGLFLGMALFTLLGARSSKSRWLIVPTVFLAAIILGRLVNLFSEGVSGPSVGPLLLEMVLVLVLIGAQRVLVRGEGIMKTSSKSGLVLPFLAVLVLVVGGAALFQRQIGLAIGKRVIDRRVAIDLAREQPDGLHVGLCGTGSPMADPKRAGPCTFVIAGERIYVVDAGDGATRNMSLMGLPIGRIDAILLTHFHSDHIGGLGEMMLVRWASTGNSKPVEVYGPRGVGIVVEGFNRAYEPDKAYRVEHHGAEVVPPSGAGGTPRPFALPEGEQTRQKVLERDGLTITAFFVDHSPVHPAVGYRFDYKGRSAVISGDTVPSANLTQAARGVDLLVHEGLQAEVVGIIHEAALKHGQKNIAKITADIPSYHTTPEDAARIAKEAGVRHLVFYHIIPPLPIAYLNAAFLGDAGEYYDGPITVGSDGLLFVMPANSDVIGLEKLL